MHGKNLKEETMLRDLKPTALLHTGQNIKQPEIPLTKAVIEDAISASAYPPIITNNCATKFPISKTSHYPLILQLV